jgi:glycosyltransferase involved in cell wall biosynthesis
MARSIITLIREDGTYLRMSQAAHKWASENFSVDRMAKEYETIIKRAAPYRI